jgi:hypothetical protein
MEIRKTIRLVGNVYHVEIDLAEGAGFCPISPIEQQQLNQFGEMLLDLGGAFTDEEDPPLEFDLPTNEVYIPSAFPIKQLFSLDDFEDDANARAVIWRDTIMSRINIALTALLAKSSGTTGSEVDNVTGSAL